METMTSIGPLGGLRVNFGAYVEKMNRKDNLHRVNGIPDYAFAMDYKLREQIRKMPFFFSLCKKLAVQMEARNRQLKISGSVLVGPRQFSDIYDMTMDCAQRLGIGIPNVFITNDQSINAATYASDSVSPTIVLNSGIVERMTPSELKCVIGHECGHIHNEHSVYSMVVELLVSATGGTTGVFGSILPLLSSASVLLLYEWERAGEVTCDRAGMICADNIQDAISVNKKLVYGTLFNRDDEVDINELRLQFENLPPIVSVFTEMKKDHPSSIRRVLTSEAFTRCDVLYKWRPEFKQPGMELRDKADIDAECEKYVAVIKEKRRSGK